MNKAFTTIALQSAFAAAVIALAAPASAATQTPQAGIRTELQSDLRYVPFVSTASRAEVRAEAIEARNAQLNNGLSTALASDLQQKPFVSTASRADVRAEAVAAAKIGQGFEPTGYSDV